MADFQYILPGAVVPLELETPKPNVFLAKRPSDLALD
jgi:hypothetical protein